MSELKKNGEVQEQQDVHRLMQVRLDKLNELEIASRDPSRITTYEQSHHATEIKACFDESKDTEVSVTGHMTSKCIMGKASFCATRNLSDDVQIYVVRDAVGEEAYTQSKKYDIGDIIDVRGRVLETKAGEVSIHAGELAPLTKNIQPSLKKSHGLTDTDQRHRRRYIDLVMNPKVRETFVKRSKTVSSVRRYLDDRGLVEVETSMSVSNVGGATACPLETHCNTLSEDVRLRISLELYSKHLIVGDLERVYEIKRVFRSEGSDVHHNPESTLMEPYQTYMDYEGMMNLTEDTFCHVACGVSGSAKIIYSDTETNLEKPFRRITMTEAVKEYSSVDSTTIEALKKARAVAEEKSVIFEERHQRGDIPNPFFKTFYEEHIVQPAFVIDHPIEIPSFTKKKSNNSDYVECLELFIYGREMCNAHSELNDPIDQRERPEAQDALAAAGDEETNRTDEDSLNVLNVDMPLIGGISYGTDRLVMLLTDSPAICDVLLFPTMKTIRAENEEAHGEGEGKAEEVNGSFTPNEEVDFSGAEIRPPFEDQVDFETFSKNDFHAVKVGGCKAVPRSKKLLQFTLDDGTGAEYAILSGIHAYYEPEELIGKTLVAITSPPSRSMMGIESYGILLSVVNERNGEGGFHLLMVDNHTPAGAKLY